MPSTPYIYFKYYTTTTLVRPGGTSHIHTRTVVKTLPGRFTFYKSRKKKNDDYGGHQQGTNLLENPIVGLRELNPCSFVFLSPVDFRTTFPRVVSLVASVAGDQLWSVPDRQARQEFFTN